MALKKNPFTSSLESLIHSLCLLNHYQFFIQSQLKRSKKSVERDLKHFDKQGWDRRWYRTGTSLPIIDIFHTGRFVVRAPTAGLSAQGEEITRLANEMERRFNAFLMVSMHEELERFLKSIYGTMLYQLRQEISVVNKRAFHTANPKWAKKEGTAPYFMEYAKHVCRRESKPALDAFAKHLDWSSVVVDRFWQMSIEDLIVVIGFCRHCIVHRGGSVNTTKLRRLTRQQIEFVEMCLYESLHSRERLILPESGIVHDCCERFASYGRGLYVLLSRRCGMADESGYFEKKSKE